LHPLSFQKMKEMRKGKNSITSPRAADDKSQRTAGQLKEKMPPTVNKAIK